MVWVAEVSLVGLAAVAAYLAWGFHLGEINARYISAMLAAMAIASVVFTTFGAYDPDRVFARMPRLRPVLMGWLITAAIMLALGWGLKVTESYSRLWAGTWFLTGILSLVVGRAVLAEVVSSLSARGRLAQRVAVIGKGESAQRLIAALSRAPATRYRVVGVIDDRVDDTSVDDGKMPSAVGDTPVLGGLDRLVAEARADRIDEVLVALPWGDEERLATVLDRLSPLPLHVRLVPDPIAFRFAHRPVTRLSGVPLIHLFERPISGWSWFLKAAEDRVLASLALVLVAPLMLLIAAAVKLDSPGPVFFRQPRRGFNSQLFEVFKFRTMRHDLSDMACDRQTTRDDPRITRIGRILRKTSLDELPQLINVLKGDMSLVGPRPHAVATKAAGKLFEDVVHEYAARYRVRPGITGWAQVNGWRGETDTIEKIEKRVEYDIHYIENWSIALDLWILVRTVLLVFRDPRAY
jgi:Undecaprenyl-phosphate glucose phosphotransferase